MTLSKAATRVPAPSVPPECDVGHAARASSAGPAHASGPHHRAVTGDAAAPDSTSEAVAGTLHNVANVLTSAGVSTALLAQGIRAQRLSGLERVATALREIGGEGPGAGPRRRVERLVEYVTTLREHLESERDAMLVEVETLRASLDHVKSIVAREQAPARDAGPPERVRLQDVVEAALAMHLRRSHRIAVERWYEDIGPLTLDEQRVLEIVGNLVCNAVQALATREPEDRRMRVSLGRGGAGRVRIVVGDNGAGIAMRDLPRIFDYAFTTKRDGHGVGLHASARAARELGGWLAGASDGPGRGATFTLELPCDGTQGRG